MKIDSKIMVSLLPDTLQKAYLGVQTKEIPVSVLKFRDGSLRVTLPEMDMDFVHLTCVITAFIENMDDLMIVAQIKDIVTRLSKQVRYTRLEIVSPIYSRYDRVMLNDKTDGFGAKVFADFVNSIGFTFVTLFDNHSEVMTKLINNCHSVDQRTIVNAVLRSKKLEFDSFNTIAPDKGAVAKNPNATVICNKVRDVTNGEITGMEVSKLAIANDKPLLVVDDLCEGGRTFIEVAKLLHHLGQPMSLFVTHGIFSNNALSNLTEHYEHVYTFAMKQETYDALDPDIKEKLTVHTLYKSTI